MQDDARYVLVPRHLIVQWLPHPEPYGGAIVVLKNKMWTDVYVLRGGRILTKTNDQPLIRYLARNKTKKMQ